MNDATATLERQGPIAKAYYQSLGRPDGISDNWEDSGVNYGFFLSRRRKKAWVLAIGGSHGEKSHTVSAEFDHRPTLADVLAAFLEGRKTLRAKIGLAEVS